MTAFLSGAPHPPIQDPRARGAYKAQRPPRHCVHRNTASGRAHPVVKFETFRHPVFTEVYRGFYTRDAATGCMVKGIPGHLEAWFTPRVFAYQIMGDGAWSRDELLLSTHGFPRASCARYASGINALFGLHSRVREISNRGTRYPLVVVPVRDKATIRGLVRPHLLPGFRYKLGL